MPTVTRLVKIFSELEAVLAAEVRSADPAPLEQRLDPSFEMRVASAPAAPIPRAEWIRQARASPSGTAHFEQMAVHDFGDVAVVSFRQTDASDTGQRAKPSARFIVDCWKRVGDGWKLAVRYSSDAPPSPAKQSTSSTTIDKRY